MSLTFAPYQKLTAADLTEINGATVRRYSSNSARDAAIPSPVAGMVCTVGTGASLVAYIYSGSAWEQILWKDTGWLTSGLTITAGASWTVDGYALRRISGRVSGVIVATYSGATLTVSTDGIVPGNPTVATLPTGWAVASPMPQAAVHLAQEVYPGISLRVWSTRVSNDALQLIGGIAGKTVSSGFSARFFVDHLAN